MPYRTLDKEKILQTAMRLEARIADRFPDSSLLKVAGEVRALTKDLGRDAERLQAPIWWMRITLFFLICSSIYLFSQVGTFVQIDAIAADDASDAVQTLEAAINTVVFVGIGMYTLFGLEKRVKRSRALKSLHGIRSVIHIIDMHQLTKDPAAFSGGYAPTTNSPKRILAPQELARYLDYCSEMLSITGKVAALYAQSIDDDIVVGAVNDIESLGSNLSGKIWQKIILTGETIGPGENLGLRNTTGSGKKRSAPRRKKTA